MIVARTIEDARKGMKRLRNARSGNVRQAKAGFVPTMGYLHAGHGSLLKQAKQENDIVILSIFVNPLQFGPNEDYETYPRDEAKDLKFAAAAGVDLVFIPSATEMYPGPMKTKVSVTDLTERLCGASRPGHFDGVTTVVTKLFHIIQPDNAYFGQKDAQQAAVIVQMVKDLNMDIQVNICPTLRETDGLALSSRNVYLSDEERSQALVLHQALQTAQERIRTLPDITVEGLHAHVVHEIQSAPLARIDYVEILSYPELQQYPEQQPVQAILQTESLIIALAVFFGRTRLIDNCIIEGEEE